MVAVIIWGTALILYGVFYCWYNGFKPKITPDEIEQTIQLLQNSADYSEEQITATRTFFESDDSKEFVMVNLLQLKKPKQESLKN